MCIRDRGWAFSWRSLMSAEIFVPILTGLGLGQLLHFGRELNSMEQVMCIMFVIIPVSYTHLDVYKRQIKRIILPSALPGVMTGLILAMARGAGEVAPLMVTGVVKLAPSLPIDCLLYTSR